MCNKRGGEEERKKERKREARREGKEKRARASKLSECEWPNNFHSLGDAIHAPLPREGLLLPAQLLSRLRAVSDDRQDRGGSVVQNRNSQGGGIGALSSLSFPVKVFIKILRTESSKVG